MLKSRKPLPPCAPVTVVLLWLARPGVLRLVSWGLGRESAGPWGWLQLITDCPEQKKVSQCVPRGLLTGLQEQLLQLADTLGAVQCVLQAAAATLSLQPWWCLWG